MIRDAKSEERKRECENLQKWKDVVYRHHDTADPSLEALGRYLLRWGSLCSAVDHCIAPKRKNDT